MMKFSKKDVEAEVSKECFCILSMYSYYVLSVRVYEIRSVWMHGSNSQIQLPRDKQMMSTHPALFSVVWTNIELMNPLSKSKAHQWVLNEFISCSDVNKMGLLPLLNIVVGFLLLVLFVSLSRQERRVSADEGSCSAIKKSHMRLVVIWCRWIGAAPNQSFEVIPSPSASLSPSKVPLGCCSLL
jgi:hypothetical protein